MLEEKTKGYQYMIWNNGNIKTFRGKFYVLGEKAAINEELKALIKKYIQLKETFAYDDGFDDWKIMKQTIYEVKDDGNFFQCSSPYGLKHYFCKHSIFFLTIHQNKKKLYNSGHSQICSFTRKEKGEDC